MWTAWILSSAVFLAFYDLAKKASVRGNAVLPVLLVSSATGTLAYVAALWTAGGIPGAVSASSAELALIAAKSLIVGSSWVFTSARCAPSPSLLQRQYGLPRLQ